VRATVAGTQAYSVKLQHRRGTLLISCTCPYFFDRGACKHLWATVLTAQDQGLLAALPTPARVHLDGEGDLLDEDELDAGIEAFAGSVRHGAGAARPLSSPSQAGATAPLAPPPMWEQLLDHARLGEGPPRTAARSVAHELLYVVDVGRSKGGQLTLQGLRVDANGILREGDLLGRLLDTFVASQLRAELPIAECRPRLYHLRQEQGRHEVDLIAEVSATRVIAIEVKASSAPAREAAQHLIWLRDQLGNRFVRGVVLHTGRRAYEIDKDILAAPIATLWA
jgi:hypothetical protein